MIEVRPGEPGWMLVTFCVPPEAAASTVAVVGDFNEWSEAATLLRPGPDGHRATLRLPAGRRYRFRYLLDGHRWQNDWEADDYEPNVYGGDDSVLDLRLDGPHRAGRPDAAG